MTKISGGWIFVLVIAAVTFLAAFPDVSIGVGTNVTFTSSPIQVHFLNGTGSLGGWSEWVTLPFPGGGNCQIGDVASSAEVRLRPGLEGLRLSARPKNTALRTTLGENRTITLEGAGRAEVLVLGNVEIYRCDVVLTK